MVSFFSSYTSFLTAARELAVSAMPTTTQPGPTLKRAPPREMSSPFSRHPSTMAEMKGRGMFSQWTSSSTVVVMAACLMMCLAAA